jgi:nucleotide-binding universal stress UspA family protein
VTYRSLVFHLDDDARADERLEQAVRVARVNECHLTGVSCHRPAPNATPDDILGDDPLTAELERAQNAALVREGRFVRLCEAAGLASFECVRAEEDADRALLRLGRCSDLVILGQPDPSEPGHVRRAEIVAQVVQRSARPTLVLPYAGRFDRIGETPLVAWDDSREAARAAADALPILRRARAVHLVRFVTAADAPATMDATTLAPVARWLERHGVKVHARLALAAGDVGNALLSHAADISADLIVMGAWGQARWTERVLGGATRTLLASMTVPTLMAH